MEPELHVMEDDLRETWVEEFAAEGVEALGDHLAKRAAFQDWDDAREDAP